jgi:hypothetical protein
VAAARSAVRALPMLAPPPGVLTVPRPAWWRRPVVGTVAAAAAAWLVVLALGAGVDGRTAPSLAAFLASHEAATAGVGAPLDASLGVPVTTAVAAGGAATAGMVTASTAGVPDPWPGRSTLAAGWALVAAVRHGDAVQLVYTDGRSDVSVFEQRGELDWSALPAGGRTVEVGDRRVWRADDGIHRVAVFGDDGLIVTVVATGPPEAAVSVAGLVPDAGRGSWLDRARRAAQGLVDTFSFRG